MPFPFGETVTLVRKEKTGVDALGNDKFATYSTDVPGQFVPAGSQEIVGGRDTVIQNPQVLLPSGTDITAIDQLIVRDETFEVAGDPQDWRHPSGWAPGIVLQLNKVTG